MAAPRLSRLVPPRALPGRTTAARSSIPRPTSRSIHHVRSSPSTSRRPYPLSSSGTPQHKLQSLPARRCLSTAPEGFTPYGPKPGDSITIALSGGVDSSVTAALLAHSQLYSLSAVFMRNWNELDESGTLEPGSGGSTGCSWQRDWADVQAVCRHLSIPVSLIDLSKEYWTQVFEPALGEWRDGVTPNPDVSCNREIKFGALMDKVLGEKEGWLATGHYARVMQKEGRVVLRRAKDRSKDQSYYLSSVGEERLRRAHFPLAGLLKSEVRELARKFGLPTAERRESMGICFIGPRSSNPGEAVSNKDGFSSFLNSYIPSQPGSIIDGDTGNHLSTHKGLHTLTVGQGARIPGVGVRYYVAKKDPTTNQITVVQGKSHPMLMCRRLHVGEVDWIRREEPKELKERGRVELLAQVRHRQVETECIVSKKGQGGYTVDFKKPVLAVAPGQVLGLWKGDWCLGSAVIGDVETLWDDQQKQQNNEEQIGSTPAAHAV